MSEAEPRLRIRATVVQTAPRLGDVAGNLDDCIVHLGQAAAEHSDLVVFPECALSGYMFSDEASARSCAEPVPGRSTDALAEACATHGLHCALGLLELDGARLHNTAVLIGPGGLIGRYRKSHIASIGADQFTVPGDEPYVVHDTPIGRIGLQICYDWRFPEITRVLALRGADGWSQIVDPNGRRLAEAGEAETTISADLDLELARAKTKEPNHGGYEVSLFGDRRPELYAALLSG